MKFIHGKYTYPDFVYTNRDATITIVCPLHGSFQKVFAYHIDKRTPQGCKICNKEERFKKTVIFYDIDMIRSIGDKVFNSLYTYPDQDPVRPHEKIKIICPIHGLFTQVLNSHKSGHHCNKCSYNLRAEARCKSIETFIKESSELHNDKYDYSEFIYSTSRDKGKITCKQCDYSFYSTPQLHLTHKLGCPLCRVRCTTGDNIYTKAIKAGSNYDEYPCSLYLVEFYNESERFLKVGITTNEITYRFRKSKYEYKVHCLFNSTLSVCIDQEKDILTEFNSYQYFPKISFNGETECFEFNSLSNIKNVLLARNGQ